MVFGRGGFLRGVIAVQSQNIGTKVKAFSKLGGIKKRYGLNFEFSSTARNQRVVNRIDADSVPGPKTQDCGRVFFMTPNFSVKTN